MHIRLDITIPQEAVRREGLSGSGLKTILSSGERGGGERSCVIGGGGGCEGVTRKWDTFEM